MLPLPLYLATLGKTQSGRVICTAGGVSSTNLVATIVSGATPSSTQLTSGREGVQRIRARPTGAMVQARHHEQAGVDFLSPRPSLFAGVAPA